MIVRKIIETGGAQILTIGLGVISGVFVTRILGAEGRGVYALFKANIDLITLFFAFGVGGVIPFYISNKEISLPKILGISTIVFFLGTLLSVSAYLVYMHFFLSDINVFFPNGYDSAWFQFYVLASFVLSFMSIILSGFLIGEKYFTDNNFSKILQAIIFIALVVGYYQINESQSLTNSLKTIFKLLFGASLVHFMSLVIFFIRRFKSRINVSFSIKSDISKALVFINLVYLGEVINFLNYRLDIWLVGMYSNNYQLGLYSLAVSVSQLLWLIATPITIVLLPFLNNEKDMSTSKAIFVFYSKLTFGLTIIACLTLLVVGDWLIPIVYGDEFAESVPAMKLLLPGIAFSSINKIFSVFIVTQNKMKYNLYAVLTGLLFTVVLDIVLIPTYGIIGASIATSLSYTVIFVFSFFVLLKVLNLGTSNYFFFKKSEIINLLKTSKRP